MAAPETAADFKRWNLSLSVGVSSFRPGAAGVWRIKGRGVELSAWWVLGFGFWVLGLGVLGSGFRFKVQGLGFRV